MAKASQIPIFQESDARSGCGDVRLLFSGKINKESAQQCPTFYKLACFNQSLMFFQKNFSGICIWSILN